MRSSQTLTFAVCIALVSCGPPEDSDPMSSAAQASGAQLHPWWDLWPRPTNVPGSLGALNANVLNAGTGPTDPGWGPMFRAGYDTSALDALHAQGAHVTGYIEGAGQNYEPIVALHRFADGGIEWDDATGAAKIEAHFWDWATRGIGSGHTESNTRVWAGMSSFISNQSWWLGPYTAQAMGLNAFYPSAGLPTVNGSSAAGYITQLCPGSDAFEPTCSRAYDALYSKGIDGLEHDGSAVYGTDSFDMGQLLFMAPGKDVAAPFWLAYQQQAMAWAVAKHGDGFWMDNTTGWDFTSSVPNKVAFGRWSIARFRDYVAARPTLSAACATPCDIRTYLRGRIEAWYPGHGGGAVGHPFDAPYATEWKDARFLDDPIWLAYLAFKGDTAHAYAAGVREALKAAAQAAGKDPSQVYLGGNDLPGLPLGALEGDELDQVNAEYGPGTTTAYALDTNQWFRGYPPMGHTGAVESTAASLENSQHAILWYYLPAPDANKPNLSRMLGFEALANNALLTQTGSPLFPASVAEVNGAIAQLSPALGYRRRAGAVALVFSSYTQATTLTPGGYIGLDASTAGSATTTHLDATAGFAGWAEALEELHTPYRVIPDYKLKAGPVPADVSVLVFPHVSAFDQATITNVLAPFFARGGVAVITGTDSGRYKTRHDSYLHNSAAILYQLTQSNPAHAKYVAGNPGFDFYVGKRANNAAQRASGLNAIHTELAALQQAGVLPSEVALQSWGTNVWVTKYASEDAAHVFYDFLNANYQAAGDALPEASGGVVTLTIPTALTQDYVFSHWHDAAGSAAVDHFQPRTGNTVRVSVPAFANYGTLVLDNMPGSGVSLVAAGRGCNDGFCLWIQGFNLSTSTQVVVKTHDWLHVLNTYSGNELAYALQNRPQLITVALATAAERNELTAHGLIVTVADHGTWDSIGVNLH